MYNEFIEGTGCIDNAYNYKVYKHLEVIYVYSGLSKEEIYKYGKRLVDNGRTPEITTLQNQIIEEIQILKDKMHHYAECVDYYQERAVYYKTTGDTASYVVSKETEKFYKGCLHDLKRVIAELNWILEE